MSISIKDFIVESGEIKSVAQKVLDYWFCDITSDTVLNKNVLAVSRWFSKSPDTDEKIRSLFEDDLIKAKAGLYDSWSENLRERLALVILLDQFSRNIYRNSPKAFEADEKALPLAFRSAQERVEQRLKVHESIFLFMPLMHSEDLKFQVASVAAFTSLVDIAENQKDKNLEYCRYTLGYARRHCDVIAQFGRFPHRNQVLNRVSTPQEQVYLNKPGAGF